jgi:DoxX-like protein
MHAAYLIITVTFALLATSSGIGKMQRDPRQVKVVHETVGVPLKYFPLLAACEFAGAVGLVGGILWPILGLAAGIGLELYFLGAIVSHLRVGDAKGIGSAVFMLAFASAVLLLRFVTV